ncbi:hypothetical protein OGAPHI_006506 [Ogataea philodendri]|uniref:Endonuclease/exonuclease/phosphatase domain-containing protein n=1 Tax=Ogataea philodendri TaxID=1378263 RepID=A0A9P8T1G4_9ASCO|nr:uncharacterized protein OGAPHI_006506 [Ogataea philodendri]KAH3661656.1 hypothetical protein OGAPHI_006506 [Ogataea philodendri]
MISADEKRRLRALKKEQKRLEELEKGNSEDERRAKLFIRRPLLELPNKEQFGKTFTIMSYNLLAQALIRRSLFPNNGDILKWNKRSEALLAELTHYAADIMCLQEMDYIQYNTFWNPELEKLGYSNRFYRSGTKNHGVAIFFRTSKFQLVDSTVIDYDQVPTANIVPRTNTLNVGLLVALRPADDPSKLLIVGTTHLFWHPFGTYERTRQTYIVLQETSKFEKSVQASHPDFEKSYKFFAGDFNSQPYDSPYLSIVQKPIKYNARCLKVISCSAAYDYADQEANTLETPVPEEFQPNEQQEKLVHDMENLHNSLGTRAISLYSLGYHLIDPENAGLDNERNEPFFSNWAHTWRGLLDYIFFVTDWDFSDCTQLEQLEDFQSKYGVLIKKLLKLPHPKEMNEGQPREGEYPSDHLCLMAEIELK